MTVNLGVVMDPVQYLKPKKDSTLAMLLAAQKRTWNIHYIEQAGLVLRDGQVWANFRPLRVKDDPNDWYELGAPAQRPGAELDVILLRLDPPFNMEYVYTTYLLERIEQSGTLVVNKPASVRDCNEKLFATWFPQCCPELVVARDMQELKRFQEFHGDVVFKPLDAMGGASIFHVTRGDPNLNVILETLTQHGRQLIMGQKYIPEISAGDTRILLIDGRPVSYGLSRIPAPGESRGNLAAGGRGVGRSLTDRDRWICSEIGPTLSAKGLLFVGIDVIGDYLTEINVTCPTCIRELDREFGLDIAGDFLDCVAFKLANSRV